MKVDETLQRAYGSIPKEVGFNVDITWIPTIRGIRYYWLILIRKITR